MSDIPANPVARIRASDVDVLVRRAAKAFDIGAVRSFTVIDVGYEDCNIDVLTTSGRYVAKVFAAQRQAWEVERYVSVVDAVVRAGVSHPLTHRIQATEALTHADPVSGDKMIVMDFVDGATYLTLARAPTLNELDLLLEQVLNIHALGLSPRPVYDSWAIPAMGETLGKVRSFLHREEALLVDRIADAIAHAAPGSLPQAFVHGDMTKANVMLSAAGDIAVLDFAVANRYPRVQELAVIAANLMHDETTALGDRVQAVANAYGRGQTLDSRERRALDIYAAAAAAMEFLGGVQEKCLKNNHSDETQHWIELGRAGLRDGVQLLPRTRFGLGSALAPPTGSERRP